MGTQHNCDGVCNVLTRGNPPFPAPPSYSVIPGPVRVLTITFLVHSALIPPSPPPLSAYPDIHFQISGVVICADLNHVAFLNWDGRTS